MMKIDNATNNKLDKKMLVSVLSIVAAFVIMWILFRYSDYTRLYDVEQVVLLRKVIEDVFSAILWGAMAFMVPYELIGRGVGRFVEELCENFKAKEKISTLLVMILLFVPCIGAVCAKWDMFWLFGRTWAIKVVAEMFIMIYGIVVLIIATERIKSPWVLMLYGLVVNLVNTFLLYGIQDKFIVSMLYCVVSVVWWIGYVATRKKLRLAPVLVFVSLLIFLVCQISRFVCGYDCVSRKLGGEYLLAGEGVVRELERGSEELGLIQSWVDDYYFVYIYDEFGIAGLIVTGICIVVMIVAAVIFAKMLYKDSPKRAALVAWMILMFLGTVIYVILIESGVLPGANITIYNIRKMFVAFAILSRLSVRITLGDEQ